MSNRKYHIDFSRFVALLLPVSLRKQSFVALLDAIVTPVRVLYGDFLLFKTEKEYHLDHNGRVFSLEKVIRDFTGSTACYISDGEYIEEVFVPFNAAGELANFQIQMPFNASPNIEIVFNSNGITGVNSSFVVHLPVELRNQIDEAELRRLIDMYRIAGKNYIILYDIVLNGYTVRWTDETCVQVEQQTTVYSVQWTDETCVQIEQQAAVYSVQWTDETCVQVSDSGIVYSVKWDDETCVQVEQQEIAVYSVQWTDEICVQVEQQAAVYSAQWTDDVCVQVYKEDE